MENNVLNTVSIGKRLGAAFLVAALITLMTGWMGVHYTRQVGEAGLHVGRSTAPLVDAVMETKLLTTSAHLVFEEIMGGDAAESIEDVRQKVKEAAWYLNVIGEGGENEEGRFIASTNPETLALAKASLASLDKFSAALEARYATKGRALSEAEFHQFDAVFDAEFDAFIDQSDQLESQIQTEIESALKGLENEISQSQTSLLILVFLALLLGLTLGQVITRSIHRPLQQCMALVREISTGNLAIAVTVHGQDEIAQLVQAMDSMRGRLLDLISSIRNHVDVINRSTSTLAHVADQSSRTSENQSEAASSMAASIEELSVSIDQVSDHARSAHETARDSGEQSVVGGKIIQDTTREMSHIAEAVNGSASTIRELESYSSQISQIVNVIKEIADQTNLLALNAAIEAARAGEQGRGFAVVADEVRKLAERTTNSTLEIAGMIGKIQQGTERAAQEMEANVQRVNEGVELAQQAGASITGIRGSADQVTQAVDEITAALSEQSSSTREIARRVEEIAQGAEENRLSIASTAASARELAALAEALQDTASRFRVA